MHKHESFYELLSKFFANEANEEERAQVEDWKKENPDEFAKLQTSWYNSENHQYNYQSDRAKEKLNQRIDALESESYSSHTVKTNGRSWLKIAACVSLLLVAIGFWFFVKEENQSQQAEGVQWIEKKTKKSQIANLSLPDGSKVKLNVDSKIRYRNDFNETENRAVFLDGEAFFEVVPNQEKPFIVQAGEVTTRVLGTSFSVYAYHSDDLAEVTVAEGKVQVHLSDSIETSILTSSRQLKYDKKHQSWNTHNIDLSTELAWMDGKLIFEDAKLSEVIAILERYYNIKFSYDKPQLQECRLSATFQHETLKNILDGISYLNNLQYTLNDGNVLLEGEGC